MKILSFPFLLASSGAALSDVGSIPMPSMASAPTSTVPMPALAPTKLNQPVPTLGRVLTWAIPLPTGSGGGFIVGGGNTISTPTGAITYPSPSSPSSPSSPTRPSNPSPSSPSSPANSYQANPDNNGLSGGAIFGIVFTVLLILAGIGGGVYYYLWRQRQEQSTATSDKGEETASPASVEGPAAASSRSSSDKGEETTSPATIEEGPVAVFEPSILRVEEAKYTRSLPDGSTETVTEETTFFSDGTSRIVKTTEVEGTE